MTTTSQFSTGLPGLDHILRGLMPGDNLVWQVDSLDDYRPFVEHLCRCALENGKKLVYFRYAKHPPLVNAEEGVEVLTCRPEAGFEAFVSLIRHTIDAHGPDTYYVFDSLSQLVVDWCSDRMLGNFFILTCPYLYQKGAIGYFVMRRNFHSFHAVTPITETAQILLDVYQHAGRLYVHPLKVSDRHSKTMYLLHVWEGDLFQPVRESSIMAEILASVPLSRLDSAGYTLGYWTQTFAEAEELQARYERGEISVEKTEEVRDQLLRMAISRDERILRLAEQYFTLSDVLYIRKRMMGTGLIGGKSVGMLLARAILKKTEPRWTELLEMHDSFFIGADVFYTYLVQNKCWWLREKLKEPDSCPECIAQVHQRIMQGTFPEYIVKQVVNLLDYYGQFPIIVRSSSLLEDNFGNAFAGKYESIFCANQGTPEERLEEFLNAIRIVYASSMSENALAYRAKRGLLDMDEQMALLIQRVSGAVYGKYYFPQAAGVGFSFNPYVWSEYIDPKAGVLRLVFGLGTRAVNRSDDDYTRLVALNAPERMPGVHLDDASKYTQRKVDLLDLEANRLVSAEFQEVIRQSTELPIDIFASRDERIEELMEARNLVGVSSLVLSFNTLLNATNFVEDMREMLKILQNAYECPVDIEFTVNFVGERRYKINLVQCRPFQIAGVGRIVPPPENLDRKDIVLEAHGAVIGQGRVENIDRLICVVPSAYGKLPNRERYSVARLIGKITHLADRSEPGSIMLLGPGRWGTTTPSLGVPVSFAEISSVSVLCELVMMNETLTPDVSLGTHFFCEMVEMDILYLALFPEQKENYLNIPFLEGAPNRLAELLPSEQRWEDVVRIIDIKELDGDRLLSLNANTYQQKAVCYFETKKPEKEMPPIWPPKWDN